MPWKCSKDGHDLRVGCPECYRKEKEIMKLTVAELNIVINSLNIMRKEQKKTLKVLHGIIDDSQPIEAIKMVENLTEKFIAERTQIQRAERDRNARCYDVR